MPADRVCVARVGAAHGVRGEVRLWSFTADPVAISRYGPLETEDGTQRFEIEALRPADGYFVARLRGVVDRAAAERLNNVALYVPREKLPPAEEEEFYYADLVGLAAHDQQGTRVGMVVAVHNFGAGDILEIERPGGGASVMLPFSKAAVPMVDLAAERIVVDPPAGVFED